MAPRAGFDTEQVRDKARKDLLHLLEGVSRCIRSEPNAPQLIRSGCAALDGTAETDRQCAPPRFAARRTS